MNGNWATQREGTVEGSWFQAHSFLRFCIALGLTFLIAELLGLNRFLRTWIQGRAFVAYLIVLYLGLVLTLGLLLSSRSRFAEMKLWTALAAGALIGFVCSIVADLLSPLLTGRGFSPVRNALHRPVYLMAVGGLLMGWLSGALTAFTWHSLIVNKKRLLILITICLVIWVLETSLEFHGFYR